MHPLIRVSRALRANPPDITGVARSILVVIAGRVGDDGETFVSIETLAADAGYGTGATKRALSALVAGGYIHRKARRRGGRVTSTLTAIAWERIDALHGSERSAHEGSQGSTAEASTDRSDPRPTDPRDPQTTDRRDPLRSPISGDLHIEALHSTRIARPTPRRAKKVSDPHPRHREVVDHYFTAFSSARGRSPTFGGREANAISRLIAALGADTAKETIDHAFADSWWRSKVTILDIASKPDRFGQPASTTRRGARATQPTDDPSASWGAS